MTHELQNVHIETTQLIQRMCHCHQINSSYHDSAKPNFNWQTEDEALHQL